jgi:hypothetical protein
MMPPINRQPRLSIHIRWLKLSTIIFVPIEVTTKKIIVTAQKKGTGQPGSNICNDSTVAQQLTNISTRNAHIAKIFRNLFSSITLRIYNYNYIYSYLIIFHPPRDGNSVKTAENHPVSYRGYNATSVGFFDRFRRRKLSVGRTEDFARQQQTGYSRPRVFGDPSHLNPARPPS